MWHFPTRLGTSRSGCSTSLNTSMFDLRARIWRWRIWQDLMLLPAWSMKVENKNGNEGKERTKWKEFERTCKGRQVHKQGSWLGACFYQGLKSHKMNLLGHLKWPSIFGLTHGRHINIIVKDIFILIIDPFCKSSDVRENTKELKCRLNLLGSFTSKVTWLNKVCNILKEWTMRRGHVKIRN